MCSSFSCLMRICWAQGEEEKGKTSDTSNWEPYAVWGSSLDWEAHESPRKSGEGKPDLFVGMILCSHVNPLFAWLTPNPNLCLFACTWASSAGVWCVWHPPHTVINCAKTLYTGCWPQAWWHSASATTKTPNTALLVTLCPCPSQGPCNAVWAQSTHSHWNESSKGLSPFPRPCFSCSPCSPDTLPCHGCSSTWLRELWEAEAGHQSTCPGHWQTWEQQRARAKGLPFLQGWCCLSALKERGCGAWETASGFGCASPSPVALGLPHGRVPTAQMFGRSKWLLAASSLRSRVRTHPLRLPGDSACPLSSLQGISLPFLCFPKPHFIFGTPCSPGRASRERSPLLPLSTSRRGEPAMFHGFSTLFPCLWNLVLLGWEAQGPVTLCSTPEPPTPTAERSWGVSQLPTVTRKPPGPLCLRPLQIPAALSYPHSPGGVFQPLLKSWDPCGCTRYITTPLTQRLLLFTSMESLFGTSEVSIVRCMQKKTLLGCRRVQFTLLINRNTYFIFILSFLNS